MATGTAVRKAKHSYARMRAPPYLSIIIACYNEEQVLAESVRQLIETLEATRWSYELIFVDDCSKDRTRVLLMGIRRAYPDVRMRILYHHRNMGRGKAVADGIHAASGSVVGFLDIDLEVKASDIPRAVLAIQHGADVATALRIYKLNLRLLHRILLSKGYAMLVRSALKTRLRDTETGFKFFGRESIMPVLERTHDSGWFWDTEIMIRSELAGLRIVEIPCYFTHRFDKTSSTDAVKDTIDYARKLWAFRNQVSRWHPARASAGASGVHSLS